MANCHLKQIDGIAFCHRFVGLKVNAAFLQATRGYSIRLLQHEGSFHLLYCEKRISNYDGKKWDQIQTMQELLSSKYFVSAVRNFFQHHVQIAYKFSVLVAHERVFAEIHDRIQQTGAEPKANATLQRTCYSKILRKLDFEANSGVFSQVLLAQLAIEIQ